MQQYKSPGSEKQKNRKLSGNFERGKYFFSVNPQSFEMHMGEINSYLINRNDLDSPTTICRLDEGIKNKIQLFPVSRNFTVKDKQKQ